MKSMDTGSLESWRTIHLVTNAITFTKPCGLVQPNFSATTSERSGNLIGRERGKCGCLSQRSVGTSCSCRKTGGLTGRILSIGDFDIGISTDDLRRLQSKCKSAIQARNRSRSSLRLKNWDGSSFSRFHGTFMIKMRLRPLSISRVRRIAARRLWSKL